MMGLGALEPELRRDLDMVEKAALDAAGVVRRLQNFSKQQRQSDFVAVNMKDVCADAVDFLRPLWRGRRRTDHAPISVQVHCESSLWVAGDPTQLREVVTNLVKNSMDALGKGGHIWVSAATREGKVRVRVQDDGSGIAAEHLPRIFDPFFTTKGDRGTGLGLYLSQQIAERHGGTITVDSRTGQGTIVTLTLPRAPDSNGHPDASAGPPKPAKAALRVVVIDDDAEVLRPLCAYLRKSGFEVVPASDAREGLQAISKAPPDVVLSDIGMPGMSGIDLCRKAQELTPSLPVVLMSGWATEIDPLQVRDAGARAVLSKPFAMQQVTELLASLAKSRQK
jgi:CheY-like chemotaxis protein/anti-sigma regulatory factor (Ser/Thr protein kinase)